MLLNPTKDIAGLFGEGGNTEGTFTELIDKLQNETGSSDEQILSACRQRAIQSMNDPHCDLQDLAKTTWYINMFDQQSAKLNQLILRCMAQSDMKIKKIGYSACQDIVSPDDEFALMATNLIRKDLESSSMFTISLALQASSTMMSKNMSNELFSVIQTHLTSSRPYIRKKAIFALFRVYYVNPDLAESAVKGMISLLRDPDYGVLAAVLSVMAHAAKSDDSVPLIMAEAPRLLHILKNTTNNWVRIRILKLITRLYNSNLRLEAGILDFVQDKLNFGAYSVRYECLLSGVTCLTPGSDVYKEVKERLFVVFDESDSNLRVIGLKMLEIAARRDREAGVIEPIPDEYFEKMVNLTDVDDATTNYYALKCIAIYASGDQAASICDKLLDVAVRRKMPYLALQVVDILERENLFDKPASLFLLGDMWRNSAVLSHNNEVIRRMDELTQKLAKHHKIILIAIPTIDEENTPRENVHPQLYTTILRIFDTNVEQTQAILRTSQVPGYDMERFVRILRDFMNVYCHDSLLYLLSASILIKFDVEIPQTRGDLVFIQDLLDKHDEVEKFYTVEPKPIDAVRRLFKKKAALKTPVFERDIALIEENISAKMQLTKHSRAPWPDMHECLPFVSGPRRTSSTHEGAKSTKDILLEGR